MRSLFNQSTGCLFLLIVVVLSSGFMIYRLVSDPTLMAQQVAAITPATATLPGQSSSSQTTQACSKQKRTMQMGVAFPQWTPQGYSGGDQEWLNGLPDMRNQTASCWVEMPVLLYQDAPDATVVHANESTPEAASLRYGIQFAHALGLHVFVTMLVKIGGSQPWAGAIQFSNQAQEQQWFASYWQAVKPYAQAAQEAGAEQFALGTEEEWLQKNAPADLWNTLITQVHSVFAGQLTYDTNWSDLADDPPAWMLNPALRIGVSAYLPQIPTQLRLSKQQISDLWKNSALPQMDAFAAKVGGSIFISEMGYRNSTDALYHTWEATSTTPVDPQEQADAYAAAFANIATDQHIQGCFVWGWQEAGPFSIKGLPAVQTIQTFYRSWQG